MSIYKVYSIGPTWSWPVMLPRLVTLSVIMGGWVREKIMSWWG